MTATGTSNSVADEDARLFALWTANGESLDEVAATFLGRYLAAEVPPESWTEEVERQAPRLKRIFQRFAKLSAAEAERKAKTITIIAANCAQTELDERVEAAVGKEDDSSTEGVAALRSLQTYSAEMPQFLWRPYLVQTGLNLVVGDYGDGKTWLALAIVAHGTRGWQLPGPDGRVPSAKVEPWRTLYLTTENDPATLRFRIDRLGGDPSMVTVWDTTVSPLPQLKDLSKLDAALAAVQPRLLVIDPLQSALGHRLDMNRANEVRAVLDALVGLARKHETTPLILMHLNKATTLGAKHRIMGSIDFAAAARSILLIAPEPSSRTHKVLAHLKCSVAGAGVSQVFVIDGPDAEVAFAWVGTSDMNADELLTANAQRSEQADTKVGEAVAFLSRLLANGPAPKGEIEQQATECGISTSALRRAAGRLGVRFESGGFPRKTTWRLPERHIHD